MPGSTATTGPATARNARAVNRHIPAAREGAHHEPVWFAVVGRVVTPDDPRHGTENGYHNQGCRCHPCTRAHAEYQAQKYAERLTRDVPAHVHGSLNGYANYGCRCVPCTDAKASYDARWRVRRKSQSHQLQGSAS